MCAKLSNRIFHPLEGVSRYSDPCLQVDKNTHICLIWYQTSVFSVKYTHIHPAPGYVNKNDSRYFNRDRGKLLNPQSSEISLYKPWRPKVFSNLKSSKMSYSALWIPTCMLLIYGHYKYVYSYSAGIDFRRRNLQTSDSDVKSRSPRCRG